MTDIFISYRRQDAAADAGRLYDDLQARSVDADIFMDLEGIPPGQDFRASLAENVGSAKAVLVLIGPRWLDLRNEATGERRLNEAVDYVRFEIETALARNKRVIPVLLPGARMPATEQLPESIRNLAYRNAYELGYKTWGYQVDQLTRQLPDKWAEVGKPARPTWKTWALLLGVAIPILSILHLFVLLELNFDPQWLLTGLALLMGVFTGRLNFTLLEQSVLASAVSLGTGVLVSTLVPMLNDEPDILGSVLRSAGFVGILFAGYLVGAMLLPTFTRARRSIRSAG
jgi:hypothetical protein